jgi:bacteriocin biosynthesis cyclodehydratase domain-containing protein
MSAETPIEPSAERLRALPVQLMTADNEVILVRGATTLRIAGERAGEVVPELLEAASGEGTTARALVERFAAPDREEVTRLVDELRQRHILVVADGKPPAIGPENSLEVFYWQFGREASAAVADLAAQPIVLLGVNTISRRIAASLRALGVDTVKVVDFHVLRNLRLFNDDGLLSGDAWEGEPPISYDAWAETLSTDGVGCLVAASDFGGPYLLREWNAFCVEEGVHFLPVVLDRFIGTVGPLVIPGETACYECFRSRENANLDAPEIVRLVESGAAERQAVTGFHPAMTGVLGEIAAMELCKLYGGGLPWHANRIIEVNLLEPSLTSRRVLRLPRCPVCSTIVKTSSAAIDKGSFVPGNRFDYHEFR